MLPENRPGRINNGEVFAIFGVNGTGKTVVAKEIADKYDDIKVVHASQELSESLGDMSREQMELLPHEQKLGALSCRLAGIINKCQENGETMLLESHLLVPIRQGGEKLVRMEDMWNEEMGKRITRAVILVTDPEIILERRRKEFEKSGRIRDMSLENIRADQEANTKRFNELVESGQLPEGSIVISNNADTTDDVIDEVAKAFEL